MKLGDRIRKLRDKCELTQGQLAQSSSVSQGYLSQLENGEVKNPSAAVLLRVAQAMNIDPDDLFEAAGYPTVRTLREVYERYEIDDRRRAAGATWRACRERSSGACFRYCRASNRCSRVQNPARKTAAKQAKRRVPRRAQAA